MTIFEKIIARQIPAEIVWEDEKHLAFMDVKPVNKGHLLVIPKKAVGDVLDMSDEEYADLMIQAKKLAVPLRQAFNSLRVGFIIEGFGINHVHVHLVPIYKAFELDPNRAQEVSAEELHESAQRFKKILNTKELM
jgi:histidine triad (HIT) family protein